MNKAEQLRQITKNVLRARQLECIEAKERLRAAKPQEIEKIYSAIIAEAEDSASRGFDFTNYSYDGPEDDKNFHERIPATGEAVVALLKKDGFEAKHHQADLNPTPWQPGYEPYKERNPSLVINLSWKTE